jgi:ABC-2 type transport system ATP-binding protein
VLRDVSLEVARGEIVGLLGPNGAGKSTALHAIVGLVPAESGELALEGERLAPGGARVRERSGMVFQEPALDGRLGARRNLRLAAALRGLGGAAGRARVEEALAEAAIPGREDDPVRTLSGGMRRRVELARALVHDPALLLMDEPTTGLDEASFRATWEGLRERADGHGVAVLLTTHRETEAERCDRLAVLHEGRIVASGTPDELRERVGGDVVEIEVEDAEAAAGKLRESLDLEAEAEAGKVRIVAERGHELVPRVVEALPRGSLRSLTMHGPGLADAYLALTGSGLANGEAGS